LKQGLRESEEQVKSFADKSGREAEGLTKKFSLLQETISKVLIPAIIARQVTQFVAQLDKLSAKLDEFTANARTKAVEASRSLADIGREQTDEIDKQIESARKLALERKQQLITEAEHEESLLRQAGAWESLKNFVAGISEGSFRSRAADEIETIDQQLRQAEERLERRRQARRNTETRDLIAREFEALSIFEQEERASRDLHQERLRQAREIREEQLRTQEALERAERERHEERLRQIREETRSRAQASAIGALGTTTSLANVEALLGRIASRTTPTPWKR
jgi:hypothetical protein